MSKFYLIIDNTNHQVLSDYQDKNDIDWDDSNIVERSKDIYCIHSSARFVSLDEANNAIKNIAENMKNNGEYAVNFSVVYVEAYRTCKDIVSNVTPLKLPNKFSMKKLMNYFFRK